MRTRSAFWGSWLRNSAYLRVQVITCLLAFNAASAAVAQMPSTAVLKDTAEPKRTWTILVYGAVDNSADGGLIALLDKMRLAIDDDPGVELLLFIDRNRKPGKRATYLADDFTTTRLYRLRRDSVERLSGGGEFPEITVDKDVKLNSADAANLGRFIAWGKAHYPARRYGLMIYSHADGKSMCPVAATGDHMGIAELTDKVGADARVDFLALELCFMGGIEIAYQWRPGNGRFEADVLLAVPNAGPSLDWDRVFARIRSPGHASKTGPTLDPASMTATDLGRLTIEECYRGRQTMKYADKEAAGCYDLHMAGAVKKAIDALSVELARADAKNIVLELRGSSPQSGAIKYVDDDGTVDYYVDLYDLCRRLAGCDRLGGKAREAARQVMATVERFMIVSYGMRGYKGFEPGKNGVFIVLPSGKPGCWKEFGWYTPLAGKGKDYGRWSFLRDGATPGNGRVHNWFQLLEFWFDETAKSSAINQKPKKNVGVFLFDGVEVIDFAGPYEVFLNASAANHSYFNVFTVAATDKAIEASGNLAITPKYRFDNHPKIDILVLPGGGVLKARRDPEVVKWIQKTAKDAEIVMSVCNGAGFLAKAGLLDGKEVTTVAGGIEGLQREVPTAKVVAGKRWVDSGKVVTCGGLSAGIDGALYVAQKALGKGWGANDRRVDGVRLARRRQLRLGPAGRSMVAKPDR